MRERSRDHFRRPPPSILHPPSSFLPRLRPTRHSSHVTRHWLRGFTLPEPRGRNAFTLPEQRARYAFTLIELMVVVGIIVLLTALLVPAFSGLKNAGDVTEAGYRIKSTLERTRAYAKANNTYAWIGLFEEDAAIQPTTPATVGKGRLVMSIVASKDGTNVYGSGTGTIDPTRLTQVDKLIRVDNVHLPLFAMGSGTGDTFDTRPVLQLDPVVGYNNGRFGELNGTTPNTAPSTSPFNFQYPLGNPAPTAQYVFTKLLQFNPRGESRVNGDTYSIRRVVEIGLVQTHGATVPNPTSGAGTSAETYAGNVAAIQISGIAGNVTIFRR